MGGAWEIYTLGGFLHKPDWQSNALCILDHVLDGGFLDERTGFIRAYRETTSGRLCLNYKHNTAYLSENAEAALAYFEAAVEIRESDPIRSREHELDGLVILRACAKHHHGAYGFLTEGVDWNDHVGQKHHIKQAKYRAIRYTEPFLNNQHIIEPTLFYLKHCARKQPADAATEWLDVEGNRLLRRASAQSLSTPSAGVTAPRAETTVPSPTVKPAGELSPQQRRRSRGSSVPGVYKAQVTPHWFQNNTRFWYRNDLRDGTKEFIAVDAEGGIRRPAFDHAKLAGALSKACGQEFNGGRLPFAEIEFIEDGKAIRVEAGGKDWRYDLNTCECIPIANGNAQSAPTAEKGKPAPVQEPGGSQSGGQPAEAEQGTRSPDGKWSAFVRGQNVFVRQLAEGVEFQLSRDGCEDNGYGMLEWAPDSSGLVAWRIEPGDIKDVYLIQSSPPGEGRAVLHKRPYALPGDKFARHELSVFDLATRKQTKPQVDRFEHEWETPHLRWARDRHHSAYVKVDRGHQRFRVIEVDARTGDSRNLVDERTDTFIWTAHTENLRLEYVNWLEKTDEMVYVWRETGGGTFTWWTLARERLRHKSPKASMWSGALRRLMKSSGRSGSAPAAATRTRTRICCISIGSTSTAPG